MVWENISGMFETTASVCGLFLWSISLSMQFSLLFLSVCWHISLSWGGDTYSISRARSLPSIPPCPCKELKMLSKQKKKRKLPVDSNEPTPGKDNFAHRDPWKSTFSRIKLWCKVWVFSWAGSSEWSLWWTPAGLRQRALSPFWAHLHTKWRQRKHVSH